MGQNRTENGNLASGTKPQGEPPPLSPPDKIFRASEENYLALFNTVRDAIAVVDLNRNLVHCNPAFHELFGYTLDEMVGQNASVLYDSQDGYRNRGEILDSLGPNSSPLAPVAYRRKSGETFLGETDLFPLKDSDGTRIGTVGLVRDITERQQSAQETKDQELKFRTLFNSQHQAIFVHPYQEEGFGHFIEVNDFACQRYGYTREEFLALGVPDITNPSHSRRHTRRSHRGRLGREGAMTSEVEHLTKAGESFPVEITSSLVELGGRKVIFAVVQDLTERERAQEALRTIQAGVGAAVGSEFFDSIVIHLSRALGADFTFVGRFSGDEKNRVRTIAFCAEGEVADPFEFDLKGTPCENMEAEGGRTYDSGVCEAFPEARLLQRLEIEGWVGVPLVDSGGEATGVLVAMFRDPVKASWEAESILDIFAARAGAELERLGQHDRLHSLEKAVESSQEAIFMTDPEGIFTYVNPGFSKMYGHKPEDVVGKETPRILKGGEASDQGYADFWNTLRDGGSMEGEFRNRTKDGGSVTVSGSAGPILDESGEITGFLAIQRDISAGKEAEKALRASEERLRSIFRAAPVGIGVVRERVLLEVNDLCCHMVGRTPEALVGQNARILYPTQRAFEWVGEEKYRQISAKGTGTVETQWVHADGHLIDVLLSSTPIDAEDWSRGVTFTALDITERKRSEAALRVSEERFRAVIEQSHDAVSIFADGRLDLINRRFSELTGYSQEDLRDPDFRFLDLFAPESRDFVEAAMELRAEGGSPPEIQKLVFLKPSGEKVHVEAAVKEIDYRGGKAVLSFIRDVSEQRALEDHLRQAQKMESIGRLSGGVAHDLNNLLTPILGYGELLIDEISPDDRRREFAEQIVEAGNRSKNLVRQLLAFSRRQTLEVKNLDLSGLVVGFQKLLRRTLREDVEVSTSLPSTLPPVRADMVQVEQVLMNLAVNAQDAMPRGGTLTIETGPASPEEATEAVQLGARDGPLVYLSLRDDGEGMDAETREKVFEPFYTTKVGGTGLGMATVFGIVTQHGGSVRVDSSPGEGTEIRCFFPAVEGVAEPRMEEELQMSDPQGTETVLVVEDEGGARKLVVDLLKRQGYRVLQAESGGPALELLGAHQGPLDLVISDVVLPGMDGRTLVREIQSRFPGTRALFISGYSDEVITRHGVLEDGLAFLQKPFSVRQLSGKVREVLDG